MGAGVAAALWTSSASAATIVVGPTDDAQNGGFDDTGCTLRDAVQSANTNTTILNGCNGDNGGGTGHDTIVLQGGQTYTLTQHSAATEDDNNLEGDLDIIGQTTIVTQGSGLATIDGGHGICPCSNPDRVIEVKESSGSVTLNRIRVQHGFITHGGAPGGMTGGAGIGSEANLTLIDSEVVENAICCSGFSSSDDGGGILVVGGNLTLNQTTVADNTATEGLANSLASARGGGIAFFNFDGAFTATNSTISGNTLNDLSPPAAVNNFSEGAGIYHSSGQMTLQNVTVSDNTINGVAGQAWAGGIYFFDNATLTGTIVAGNSAPESDDCFIDTAFSTVTTGGANVVEDTEGCNPPWGSTDATGNPANLGALANYGGLTRTHILNPGSPAINRGGSCPAIDQRSLFRYISPPCDSGSVELGATATPPPSADPGPTGQRAAALKKCKKKKSKKARKKCRKRANALPV